LKLSKLITAIESSPGGLVPGDDPDIVSLHYHTGDVKPGGLFVAIPGLNADGHNFIGQAIEKKAAAIVSQIPYDSPVPVIVTGDTRVALARLAAMFYDYPAADLVLIGLTGTNGKTTVAYIIESILTKAGLAAGVIGTIEYRFAGRTFDNPMTTPESSDLQRIFSEMKSAGITHVVMEVSSHALDLKRVYGCRFKAAVFTNLTRDHLDYHKDMDNYWACKKLLFTEHLGTADGLAPAAIINSNDEKAGELIEALKSITPAPVVLTAGNAEDSRIRPSNYVSSGEGLSVTLATPSGPLSIRSTLVGRHNLENLMSAVGVGLYLKIPLKIIKTGVESLPAVPGRLEPVLNDLGRYIFVDYAHTPDALENVLQALVRIRKARIICVFGCGGDRDRTKRPLMGAIAGRLADFTVVTSDNPRTETPDAIIAEILDGELRKNSFRFETEELKDGITRAGYIVEPERRKAIGLAIKLSRPGDIVLIAGKGHETYQILGTEKIDFDDRTEAKAALLDLSPGGGGAPGEELPSPGASSRALPWSVNNLLEATGGKIVSGNRELSFSGISIDSRTISNDDIFIAIHGENHDGHRFADDVLEKGIKGVIIRDNRLAELSALKNRYPGTVWITVGDTTAALGKMGAYHRRRTGVPVVAITGSNGKTSTRNMTAAVLSQRFSVLAAAGNFNNEIGLPLTLLRLTPDHDWAVVELGMNHRGEIKQLAKICEPSLGVITNIGPAHLEFLGSLENVKRAKGELLEELPDSGLAILNGDDQRCLELAETCRCPVALFGFSKGVSISAGEAAPQEDGLTFDLDIQGSKQTVRMNVTGRFMVANALAAAGVGNRLGLSGEQIKAGLESFSPMDGRMNVIRTKMGLNIIDDTYNANPGSMTVAIEALVQRAGKQKRFLVLGNMAELGTHAPQLHYELGQKAAAAAVAGLYIAGKNAGSVAAGAGEGGVQAPDIFVGSHPEIIADLKQNLQSGNWVLIKGSRAMQMETITEGLVKWADAHC
jgi:murE/murF fusion protein